MHRETKGFLIFFGVMAVAVEKQAKESMQNALTAAFNSATFTLEGAHAVTSNYEGRKYTYNFDNNTVLAGLTRHVGFGGGGYGGLVSFDNMEDKAAIENARVQGCLIAAQVANTANPGWPVTAEFKDAQTKAARFAATYCP
jgi:hypothetical protein